MLVSKIVALINKRLADELCTPTELMSYMDAVVDDINIKLNSKFPTISEFIAACGNIDDPDYNVFPDKYIRTVLITGAAYKYYVTDEEGNATAQQYSVDYSQNLFYMERDYSFSIPEVYREDNQGYVDNPDSDVGLWFPGKEIY